MTLAVFICQPDLQISFKTQSSVQSFDFRVNNVGGEAAAATKVHFETPAGLDDLGGGRVGFDAANPDRIVAGIYARPDGGKSWNQVGAPAAWLATTQDSLLCRH